MTDLPIPITPPLTGALVTGYYAPTFAPMSLTALTIAGGSLPVRWWFPTDRQVPGSVMHAPDGLIVDLYDGCGVQHFDTRVLGVRGDFTFDGEVDAADLLIWADYFDDGNLRADLDDGSGLGNPDGGLTIDDLMYFLLLMDQEQPVGAV